MVEMIGFRYAATGVFGYVFYQNGRRVCTAGSLVAPSPPVQIHGPSQSWTSPFDQDSTIVPGSTRYVYRAGPGPEVCRIVYRGAWYDLRLRAGVYHARAGEGGWVFFAGERRVAVIARLPRREAESIPVPRDEPCYDMEAWYKADAVEDLPEDVLTAILAFPLLRFGGRETNTDTL